METNFKYRNSGNPRLLDLLPPVPGAVLDCGCGPGDNARLLKSRGWRVTGITMDTQEREATAEFCDDVWIGDLELGLPAGVAGPYDAVLMSHVIEHLAHPETFLAAVKTKITPGGVLAVALPNVAYYRQRAHFATGRFDYTETGILDATHLRFYTFRTGLALLETNGFEVVKAIPDGSIPLWQLRRLIPAKVVDLVTDRSVKRMPNLFAYQSLYLARPTGRARSS